MDRDTLLRLLDPAGWALLTSLPPYDEATAHTLGPQLREAGFDADVVSAALTQSRLRAAAHDKLGDFADGMLFTPDGLEQATRIEVAAHHAARFRGAGTAQLFDLGCGIGADAMAAAALGMPVQAVDRHEVTALIAATNLRHFDHAEARCAAAEEVSLPTDATGVGVWLDPARRLDGPRRADGRAVRTFSLDRLSPSWECVQDVARRVPATGAKLSPAFPHPSIPDGAEAQWVSWRGTVVECSLWWGPLAVTAGRTALVMRPGQAHLVTGVDGDASDSASASHRVAAGDVVYDPDKAVLRAGLLATLERDVTGRDVYPGAGYVVSTQHVEVPYAKAYRVVEAMPLQVKKVKAWLRARGVGRLTLKKRAKSLDAAALTAQLTPRGGDGEATLIIARADAGTTVMVVETLG